MGKGPIVIFRGFRLVEARDLTCVHLKLTHEVVFEGNV